MEASMNAVALIAAEEPNLSLALPPGLPLDEWRRVGHRLMCATKAINWHIGDWWAYGEAAYGERAKAVAEGVFGKEFQSLADMGSVCRSFETSRRREALSFSHHREVAALPADEAEVLLDEAQGRGLSKSQLRQMVTRLRASNDDCHEVAARDPVHLAMVALTEAWNEAPLEARVKFAALVRAARASAGDYGIVAYTLSRWTENEREVVRTGINAGHTLDAICAALPDRSRKAVMWVYYGERSVLVEREDRQHWDVEGGLSGALAKKDAKNGSMALLVALVKHHPEMVIEHRGG